MIIRYNTFRLLGISLLSILLVVFIIPNIFNQGEKKAFSDSDRLENARRNYSVGKIGNSIQLAPGTFYKPGFFKHIFLGVSYRDLWQQPVKVEILNLEDSAKSFTPVGFTGGFQTIGIKVRDSAGQLWSVRSVNKDQAVALPEFLRSTILRPLFRDRACSMDPYGGLATAQLSRTLGLHSLEPRLYFFPYDPKLGKYNSRMAGRMVMVQKRWESGKQRIGGKEIIVLDTEEALKLVRSKKATIDTSMYLRCRLFDMLISDWDRHDGNWKWLLKNRSGVLMLEPVAVDRDIAFYNFGEGIINHIALLVDNRFQSFTRDFREIEGLMKQSRHLDVAFLSNTDKWHFIQQAKYIQNHLSKKQVAGAFKTYPVEAYEKIGKSHQFILNQRLKKLPQVASTFFYLIQSHRP